MQVLAPHADGAAKRETLDGVQVCRYAYLPAKWQRLAYDGGILPKLRANPALALQVPFLCLAMLVHAIHITRAKRIDLIHAHWIVPQGFVALLVKALSLRSVRVVTTSHGADLYGLGGPLWRHLKRWVLRRADRVTVVSEAMKTLCGEGLGIRRPITVASMGIDCRHTFVPRVEFAARRGVIYVGRLVEKKGVRDLIEAFAVLLRMHPEEHLTIVGDGPEKPALMALTEERGIGGQVVFVGAVAAAEVAKCLNQAKVAVMPSVVAQGGDQEGLGLVAGEALATGCITIVSDLYAIRDLHDEPQLQYPAGDIEQLADRLCFVIEHEREAKVLADRLRAKVVEKFSWENVGGRYRQLINETING